LLPNRGVRLCYPYAAHNLRRTIKNSAMRKERYSASWSIFTGKEDIRLWMLRLFRIGGFWRTSSLTMKREGNARWNGGCCFLLHRTVSRKFENSVAFAPLLIPTVLLCSKLEEIFPRVRTSCCPGNGRIGWIEEPAGLYGCANKIRYKQEITGGSYHVSRS